MVRKMLFFLLALALLCCEKDNDTGQDDQSALNRSFYMGFTPFPFDNTIEALLTSYETTLQNSDIALNHLDFGVPWDEALNGTDFPEEVQNTLVTFKTNLPASHKYIVTATPTSQKRNELAGYWNNEGEHESLPIFWQEKSFDDPDVINAYTNYCKRVINISQPDYFGYGIEVNSSFLENTSQFNAYKVLVEEVYTELKATFPDIPIFLSFQDRSFNKNHTELLSLTNQLLPYSDLIAMSSYPFWDYDFPNMDANPDLHKQNWLTDFRDLDPSKPFAISETGYIAEDLVINDFNLNVKGSEAWQETYTTSLLNHANELNAEFVAWFVYRDYDKLYENSTNPDATLLIWKDNGLLDGDGNKRKAHYIWDEWLKRSKD
ncbi:glycoside hydrolase family 26 protein [Spongiivirga citrea]|uniref:Arabinogalactan endo-beta-1,4-galactanase n=1 Tax=Spongiivirga citrea TaxID=1481457 RepID=A0A6M0CQ98_9FLAO|nr:hypothetical protein [Spongiivirga citrea]NER19093.1 hypothetical protein [Spongiivirga citrea]